MLCIEYCTKYVNTLHLHRKKIQSAQPATQGHISHIRRSLNGSTTPYSFDSCFCLLAVLLTCNALPHLSSYALLSVDKIATLCILENFQTQNSFFKFFFRSPSRSTMNSTEFPQDLLFVLTLITIQNVRGEGTLEVISSMTLFFFFFGTSEN